MNKKIAVQLSSSDSENRILQLMNNGRLDQACLCALADLIICQRNVLEMNHEDTLALIEGIQNGNHREILSSSFKRQRGSEQPLQENNLLRKVITDPREQITDSGGQDHLMVMNESNTAQINELTRQGPDSTSFRRVRAASHNHLPFLTSLSTTRSGLLLSAPPFSKD